MAEKPGDQTQQLQSTLRNISKCDINVEYVVLVLIIIGSVCLCLSLCLCVLTITAPHSNAKSQPQ